MNKHLISLVFGAAVVVGCGSDGAVVDDGKLHDSGTSGDDASVDHDGSVEEDGSVVDNDGGVVDSDAGLLNPPVTASQRSYHFGNSLTDSLNPWLDQIADGTGVDHGYARWTIPGTSITWLQSHADTGFGTPDAPVNANNPALFAPTFGPFDHMTLQPYSDPNLATEIDAALKLIAPVAAVSPNLQVWVYAQWPSKDFLLCKPPTALEGCSGFLESVTWSDPPLVVENPPTNWVDAVATQLEYHKLFAAALDEKLAGKNVLIIPGGQALVELKTRLEAGKILGAASTNFFAEYFEDDLHLNAKGKFLVSLVFYSCMYRQSAEGKLAPTAFAESGLTAEQAEQLAGIAWDVVKAFPQAGVLKTPTP